MRVTYKYLIKWCNDEFKRLEILDYEVVNVERTFHNQDAIEAGACRLIITFQHIETKKSGYFLSFYTIGQIQRELKEGRKLHLKFDRSYILTKTELEVIN